MNLPGYDAWKLASPPEYEFPESCPYCDAHLDSDGVCDGCGWGADDESGDAYDTLEEAEMAR